MTEALRVSLPPVPRRMAGLPVNEKGYPVPWFVPWMDGKWEFRAVRPESVSEAFRLHKCWICGGTLGKFRVFVIGPKGAINRINSEPPSHLECAEYAARVCPFLIHPNAKRREANMPTHHNATGLDPKNPGVYLLWVSTHATAFRSRGSLLFDIGEPAAVHWRASGKPATRDEAQDAVEKGAIELAAMIVDVDPTGINAIRIATEKVLQYLPDKGGFPRSDT